LEVIFTGYFARRECIITCWDYSTCELCYHFYPMGHKLFAWLSILVVFLLAGLPFKASTMPLAQSGNSPSDVIAAVNNLRAANGLPPYKANNALMSAAQAHSNYMAENKVISHTGAGGSTPKSRAVAAGYGDGATVFVSENIAMGTNLSAQGAVNIWQGDNLHLSTMISRSYQDVGAGVATNGNVTYYTLVAGNVAGSASSGAPSQPAATQIPPVSPTATISSAEFIQPLIVATAQPDGSVIHIVESGQVLTTIAAAYKIPLDQLLAQNNLTLDSIIHPGDRLLIQPAQASPTSTEGPFQTSEPTATITATTPAPIPTSTLPPQQVTPTLMPTSTPTPMLQGSVQADPLLLVILAGITVGITLVLVGSFMKQKG
jgi:uncharacterized protein YkwD